MAETVSVTAVPLVGAVGITAALLSVRVFGRLELLSRGASPPSAQKSSRSASA